MSTAVSVDNAPNACIGSCWSDDTVAVLALDLTTPSRGAVRKWPQELKDKRKTELHVKRMSRFRDRKTNESKTMQQEHLRLEHELENRIGELRRTGVSPDHEGGPRLQRELQRLVLEREYLREESVAIRQKITQHLKFKQVIQSASNTLAVENFPSAGGQESDVTVRYVDSKWQPVQEQTGRWVHFTNGKPPFFFYPFSRQEFDAVLRVHDSNASTDSEDLVWFGKFLGWSVYHGTLRPGKSWLIGHARFSKRMERSFDTLLNGMYRDDGTCKWPIMPTARDIGVTAEIGIQTPQELDDNSSVVARSYSGGVNFRYLCLVHRSQIQLQDGGKRVLKFYYVVGDSEPNARSRAADPTSQDDVCWVTDEGGYSLTLTEVDDTFADVSFDSLACLKSEETALGHFIMFGHIATRWEQLITSSNLLKF
ncbi:hypothetical protein PRIC1_004579 [Phytophthora ramorum]